MDKDLYDLASKINGKVTDTTIRARGTAVMNAFSSVVLHERHVSNYAGSHGITIYGPAAKNQKYDDAYYRTLDFAQTTAGTNSLRHLSPSSYLIEECPRMFVPGALLSPGSLLMTAGGCYPVPVMVCVICVDESPLRRKTTATKAMASRVSNEQNRGNRGNVGP